MQKGDIILIPFPFTDNIGHKMRPAVVISNEEVHTTGDAFKYNATQPVAEARSFGVEATALISHLSSLITHHSSLTSLPSALCPLLYAKQPILLLKQKKL